MKIYVLNGPNINMLGIREPDIYGSQTYADLVKLLEEHGKARGVDLVIFQSNHEGALIDKIQEAYFEGACGIVINPAGYTHTSIAILDAIKSVSLPTVEVHISNPKQREAYRHISYISEGAKRTVMGHGFKGYIEAIDFIIEEYKK